MKKEIEKLIELAKDYVVFGVEIGLPDTHNHIRGGHHSKPEFHEDGDLINIYFANNSETWKVTFKDVEVIGYSSIFQMPFDADADYLNTVYNSAKEYLEEHLLKNIAKCKIATLKERHNKIDVDDMTESHLRNVLKLILKRSESSAKKLHIRNFSKRCFCGAEYDGIGCNNCRFDASEVDIY